MPGADLEFSHIRNFQNNFKNSVKLFLDGTN